MARFLRMLPERIVRRIPGVGWLARRVERVAAYRVGRAPLGLLALLPVAVLLDVLDFFDESVPVLGSVVMFVVGTGFVLGITGRAKYALGLGALDLIPFVDIVPVATLTVLSALRDAWAEAETHHTPTGPVLDV